MQPHWMSAVSRATHIWPGLMVCQIGQYLQNNGSLVCLFRLQVHLFAP